MEFPELKLTLNGKEESIMKRTTLVANTSNTWLASWNTWSVESSSVSPTQPLTDGTDRKGVGLLFESYNDSPSVASSDRRLLGAAHPCVMWRRAAVLATKMQNASCSAWHETRQPSERKSET